MIPPETPEERLFGEAINLSIRLRSLDRPAAQEAVRAWRARSPQHDRIWSEVAEIEGLAGIALAADRPAAVEAVPGRRRVLGLAIGAAAAGVVGGLAGPGLITAARADHRTGTAEQRRIEIGGGSSITLGPASAVALAGPRRLYLLSGMLACDIAAAEAPFRLAVQDATLTARAAHFALSSEDTGISVSAITGELTSAGVTLAAGTRTVLDAGGRLQMQDAVLPGEAMAWTESRIITRGAPVAMLVEQIARWLPGRVILADPALAARHSAGTFDLRDPDAALAAVVLPHGGRVRRVSGWLRIVSVW